jgi:NAD(P)-dependent dehydrogenase (short-subunit alcohol dehydrogenase family)
VAPSAGAKLMAGMAFGRAAKPEEIAAMVAFLASDKVSGYTTGSIIKIDGGGSSRRSAL